MELVGGYITHKIHGAGIYANIWGILMVNHIYIYSSTMDPMGNGGSISQYSVKIQKNQALVFHLPFFGGVSMVI